MTASSALTNTGSANIMTAANVLIAFMLEPHALANSHSFPAPPCNHTSLGRPAPSCRAIPCSNVTAHSAYAGKAVGRSSAGIIPRFAKRRLHADVRECPDLRHNALTNRVSSAGSNAPPPEELLPDDPPLEEPPLDDPPEEPLPAGHQGFAGTPSQGLGMPGKSLGIGIIAI